MAAVLLAAGSKGQRSALPHSRMLLHQPLGNLGGQASDIDIAAREILLVKSQILDVLSEVTGQTIAKLREDTDRDFFLRPEEAVDYGLIDKIIRRKE